MIPSFPFEKRKRTWTEREITFLGRSSIGINVLGILAVLAWICDELDRNDDEDSSQESDRMRGVFSRVKMEAKSAFGR